MRKWQNITLPSTTPYTKHDPLCQKMAAIWRTLKIIMAVYIYRVELDSSVLKIARKEMQDTVDGTGLNLLKQTRKQKFNVKKTAAGV